MRGRAVYVTSLGRCCNTHPVHRLPSAGILCEFIIELAQFTRPSNAIIHQRKSVISFIFVPARFSFFYSFAVKFYTLLAIESLAITRSGELVVLKFMKPFCLPQFTYHNYKLITYWYFTSDLDALELRCGKIKNLGLRIINSSLTPNHANQPHGLKYIWLPCSWCCRIIPAVNRPTLLSL